jgi:hypothetical protein
MEDKSSADIEQSDKLCLEIINQSCYVPEIASHMAILSLFFWIDYISCSKSNGYAVGDNRSPGSIIHTNSLLISQILAFAGFVNEWALAHRGWRAGLDVCVPLYVCIQVYQEITNNIYLTILCTI